VRTWKFFAVSTRTASRPRPEINGNTKVLSRPKPCRFLRKNGYRILYRNFRGRTGGEIDVVCRDRDTLVFVEVKTRTREDFGRPVEAVNREKRQRIARGGLAWLRLLGDPDILFRFDVVEVIIADGAEPRLEILRNAFSLPEPYIY